MPISGISQGLGIGGGATATSSGAPGGGAPWANEYSVAFDGTNEYMDAGTSSDYSIVGGGSISYWIYPSFPMASLTESVGKRSTAGWQITQSNVGINCFIYVFNHSFAGAGPVVTVNNTAAAQWYLITNVFHASGGATMYLNDGAAGASGTGQTSAKPSYSFTEDASAPLYFARHPTSITRCFPGNMDEIAVFSSELSASDVSDIYNGGAAIDLGLDGLDLSPASWWRMGDNDGATGSTITNQGSGGNNGTLTNGPTFSTTVPS